jgi:hypothetical protein
MSRTAPPKSFSAIVPDTPVGLSKWIPLLCAGAAAGVSLVALKEIKNLRTEVSSLKNNTISDDINKRMKNMESQLRTLTEFIKTKNDVPDDHVIIKNAVKEPTNIKIINNEEYEEIEVTDDDET